MKDKAIKRYDPEVYSGGDYGSKGARMYKSTIGDYVEFSDHIKALTDQSSYYEGRVEVIEEWLSMDCNATGIKDKVLKAIKSIFNTEDK